MAEIRKISKSMKLFNNTKIDYYNINEDYPPLPLTGDVLPEKGIKNILLVLGTLIKAAWHPIEDPDAGAVD